MRVVPVVALLCLLMLSSFAIGTSGQENKFAECPDGYECSPRGDPYPPDLVTGHTVFAKWILTQTSSEGSAAGGGEVARFPAPPVVTEPRSDGFRPAPPGPQPTSIQQGGILAQAECVAWSSGQNLDVRPDSVQSPDGDTVPNGFFSDEDLPGGASQDYDPGQELDSCLPAGGSNITFGSGRPTDFAAVSGYFHAERDGTFYYGAYAVVVERGDCRPATGIDFRYRGHLDFVDPNGYYHEVQEYDYVCGGSTDGSGPAGNEVPGATGVLSGHTAEAVKDLFPLTRTDPRNDLGCYLHDSPASTVDPLGANVTGHFDLGHKCNGSVQDLFTERLWITPIHDAVWDTTIEQHYNFALVVDTCSGQNIAEGWPTLLGERDIDALDYFLDQTDIGQPLVEVCHDGSSFSFDDTPRARTTHNRAPADEGEIMRGNAYDFQRTSPSFGMHRNNCRSNYIDWSWNDHPGPNPSQGGPAGLFGPGWRSPIGEDCFPEDHKNAQIEIYIFGSDPTGLFAYHGNGLTGANQYQPDATTGPNYPPS